jgi:ethanolaminephosphotransferase
LQNVDQISAIISATFGSHLWHAILETDCAAPSSDAEQLVCERKKMMSDSGTAAAHGDVDASIFLISKVCRLDSPLLQALSSGSGYAERKAS